MFDDNVPKDQQGKTPLELACMSVSGDPLGAAKILASLTGYPTPKSRQDLIDIRIGITRKLIVPWKLSKSIPQIENKRGKIFQTHYYVHISSVY